MKMNDLEKKGLAQRIAILCLEINSIGDKRQIEIEEGKPCVFLNLSGHVGNIDVGVNENGWELNSHPDKLFRLNEYSPLSKFTDCLAYLEGLFLAQAMEAETEKNGDEEGKELSVDTNQAVGA